MCLKRAVVTNIEKHFEDCSLQNTSSVILESSSLATVLWPGLSTTIWKPYFNFDTITIKASVSFILEIRLCSIYQMITRVLSHKNVSCFSFFSSLQVLMDFRKKNSMNYTLPYFSIGFYKTVQVKNFDSYWFDLTLDCLQWIWKFR